jgi:hypothetical protein
MSQQSRDKPKPLAVTELRVRAEDSTCHTQYRVRVPAGEPDWLAQLHEQLMRKTSDPYDEPKKVHDAEIEALRRRAGASDLDTRSVLTKMREVVQPEAFFRDQPTDPVTEETLQYVSSFSKMHCRAAFDPHITLGR